MSKFKTSFKLVGAAYDETLVLLRELHKRGSWSEVVKAAHAENLLKKRSSSWIEMLLRSTRKRYLEEHPSLPEGMMLSKFLLKINSHQSRRQTLFQYICETHPLVDLFVVELVGSNLRRFNSFRLTRPLFGEFFSEQAEGHPELKDWAEYTKEKWRRDFYAFLRSSGLMEKHPSVLVRRFIVKPEVFAFFLFGLISRGFSPSEILSSRLWKRYFLSYEEVEEALSECQVKGWLQYRSMGTISELIPRYGSLEEWLDAVE